MKKTIATALITGAGRGIGRAIAMRLSFKYRLILVTKTKSSAKKLQTLFPKSSIYSVDLTKRTKLNEFVREVRKAFNQLDVIINNAGVYYGNLLEHTTDQRVEEMVSLHLKVPFILIRELLPLLRTSPQKQIINISSAANFARLPTESAYTATKAGLTALGDVLQRELQRPGIKVSTIHPWSVNTKNFPDGKDFLKPEDIADVVEFILSRNKNCQILNIEISGVKDWRGDWPPWVKGEK